MHIAANIPPPMHISILTELLSPRAMPRILYAPQAVAAIAAVARSGLTKITFRLGALSRCFDMK